MPNRHSTTPEAVTKGENIPDLFIYVKRKRHVTFADIVRLRSSYSIYITLLIYVKYLNLWVDYFAT